MTPSPTIPRKILLVEDDACTAILFKSLLSKEGYVVEHSADGEAALQVLWKTRFDAVVLDLMMPKLDGVQVLKAMRSLPDHVATPVIVMSAAKLKLVEEEALRYGAKMFLDKTELDKLVTVLRQILADSPGSSSIGLKMAPLTPLQLNQKGQTDASPNAETRSATSRLGGFFHGKSQG